MPLDLAALVSTPDLRAVPTVQSRLVRALRYVHVARERQEYCPCALGQLLGNRAAVHPLHVFLSEACQAWPDPIALNRPCQPQMSYDEMLLVDCTSAAARTERAAFDSFLSDMVSPAGRRSLWLAAIRLMRAMQSTPGGNVPQTG